MAAPALVKNWFKLITRASFIVSGIISASWASRIPEVQASFLLSDREWGTVLISLYAGLICGLPVSTWLIAKFGPFKVAFISSLLFAVMLSLLPQAPSVLMLILCLFVYGMMRNLMNLSINTNSLEVQKYFDRSIISAFHGSWSLSSLLAAGLGTLMIASQVSPAVHFVAVSLIAVVIIVMFRSSHVQKEKIASDSRAWRMPDKFLLVTGALSFSAMACEGAIYDWGVNYFQGSVDGGKQLVTAGYISYLLAMTLGRFAGDYFITRIGRQRLLLANGILITTGFLLASLLPSFLPAIFAFVLIGIGNAVMIPITFFVAGKSKQFSTAAAIATVSFMGYCGLLLQPVIVGFISASFSMRAAFGVLSVPGLAIVFIAFYLKEQQELFE